MALSNVCRIDVCNMLDFSINVSVMMTSSLSHADLHLRECPIVMESVNLGLTDEQPEQWSECNLNKVLL